MKLQWLIYCNRRQATGLSSQVSSADGEAGQQVRCSADVCPDPHVLLMESRWFPAEDETLRVSGSAQEEQTSPKRGREALAWRLLAALAEVRSAGSATRPFHTVQTLVHGGGWTSGFQLACCSHRGSAAFIDPREAVALGSTAAPAWLCATQQQRVGGGPWHSVDPRSFC